MIGCSVGRLVQLRSFCGAECGPLRVSLWATKVYCRRSWEKYDYDEGSYGWSSIRILAILPQNGGILNVKHDGSICCDEGRPNFHSIQLDNLYLNIYSLIVDSSNHPKLGKLIILDMLCSILFKGAMVEMIAFLILKPCCNQPVKQFVHTW
jgi:hypothetical protein